MMLVLAAMLLVSVVGCADLAEPQVPEAEAAVAAWSPPEIEEADMPIVEAVTAPVQRARLIESVLASPNGRGMLSNVLAGTGVAPETLRTKTIDGKKVDRRTALTVIQGRLRPEPPDLPAEPGTYLITVYLRPYGGAVDGRQDVSARFLDMVTIEEVLGLTGSTWMPLADGSGVVFTCSIAPSEGFAWQSLRRANFYLLIEEDDFPFRLMFGGVTIMRL